MSLRENEFLPKKSKQLIIVLYGNSSSSPITGYPTRYVFIDELWCSSLTFDST